MTSPGSPRPDRPPAQGAPRPGRHRVLAVCLLLGALLCASALLNRQALADAYYRWTLEREFRKTDDAYVRWGSPEARLQVRAFLPFDCLCQGDRVRVFSASARKYGDAICIELINMDSRAGSRHFDEAGLSCSGLFLNGRQKLKVTLGGKTRAITFTGPPVEETPGKASYSSEELQAAIDQEMARLYPHRPWEQAAQAPGKLPLPMPRKDTAAPEAARAPDLDPGDFDRLAKTLFAPVYPLLAKQIVEDYKITTGRALEVGCGPAYLSIELAKRTKLQIVALDVDDHALTIAKQNVTAAGLTGRVIPTKGDVMALAFPADHFDLIVSRCSVPCWPNKVTAFREMNRVLKPGGVGFVGVGSGRYLPEAERRRIVAALNRLRKQQGEQVPWLKSLPSTRFLQYCVWKANLKDPKITRTDDGFWVEWKK